MGCLPIAALRSLQKVTVFSPDGEYLAVAGSSEVCSLIYAFHFVLIITLLQLSLSTIPELVSEVVSTKMRIDKGEIYDAAFSESTVDTLYDLPQQSDANWSSWLWRQP